MKLQPIHPIPDSVFEKIGFYWYQSPDSGPYVADELLILTESEGDAYYRAAHTLYDLYIEAAQYVMDHGLYSILDIPENLIEMIVWSWENDAHFHLLGRFDFAGGLDGLPIKLIEFNADTPSMLFETALIQWMMLKHNGISEERQYNSLYETIQSSFGRIKSLHPRFALSDSIPHALFSCLSVSVEDENTTRLLEEAAYEAGYITGFEYADDVCFDGAKGVMNSGGDAFDYWFKLIPYEYIGREEPELAAILTELLKSGKVVLLNPPYSLLFQSKGIMKVLWDLFPGHPLLLETDIAPLAGRRFVEKKTLSREGANVRILDSHGIEIEATEGDYVHYRSIYQDFVALPEDEQGRRYQAGVFFSYEACGIGFRREKGIIHDQSQFVGHMIAPNPIGTAG